LRSAFRADDTFGISATDTPRAAQDASVLPLLQERFVHDLLYTSPVALFVVDDEMRVLVANDAAARLSGYSVEELTNLEAWEITGDPEQSARNAERVHVGGRLTATNRLRHKQGHEITCTYFAWEVKISRLPFIAILMWADDAEA
jgi:PAS domain S-box-containing protein